MNNHESLGPHARFWNRQWWTMPPPGQNSHRRSAFMG